MAQKFQKMPPGVPSAGIDFPPTTHTWMIPEILRLYAYLEIIIIKKCEKLDLQEAASCVDLSKKKKKTSSWHVFFLLASLRSHSQPERPLLQTLAAPNVPTTISPSLRQRVTRISGKKRKKKLTNPSLVGDVADDLL